MSTILWMLRSFFFGTYTLVFLPNVRIGEARLRPIQGSKFTQILGFGGFRV